MNRLWALIWTCTRETDTGTFSCSCRGDWRLFDTEITPFFFWGGEGDCILVSILCYKQIAARHTHTTDGIAPSIQIGKKIKKPFYIFGCQSIDLPANEKVLSREMACQRVLLVQHTKRSQHFHLLGHWRERNECKTKRMEKPRLFFYSFFSSWHWSKRQWCDMNDADLTLPSLRF